MGLSGKKLRVGFDINGTLDNFVEALLMKHNQKYGDSTKIDSITSYNMHKFLNPKVKPHFEDLIDEEFIRSLELRDGAKELLDFCYKNNFEIRFVTAVYPQYFG